MKLEDVKSLRTVNNHSKAQQLLGEGWRILAVCVKQDGNDQYAEYHLGHTQLPDPLAQFDPEQIQAALAKARGKVLGPKE